MTGPTPSDRRARAAVAVVFLTNGALFANAVPRLPEVKAAAGLGNAAFGAAVAAGPFSALAAGLVAAAAIPRFGSARVATLGTVAFAAVLPLVAAAHSWFALAAVLFAVGALDSVVDVAQNAHGLRVQRRYGRSLVNGFHGLWSVGAVLGGVMGSAAAGLGVPLGWHLVGSSLVFSAVALVCLRFLLPGRDHSDRPADGPRGVRGLPVLLALGVLAACGAVVEDAGSSWGAVYLSGSLHTGAAVAGLAFVALNSAMTAGRLLADRVVDRFGEVVVVRAGAVATVAGMSLVVLVPGVPTTIAGFGLCGLGVAPLVPAAMHTADLLPGLRPGVGLTVVTWLLRAGSLLSPPLTGVVADATSLRVALLLVVASGVLTLVLSGALRRPRAQTNP